MFGNKYSATELNSSGVYAIVNLISGKRYIGSATKSFKSRWFKHVSDLKLNKHHSPYLQRSWNKYGKDCFEFKILEIVLPENCISREQWWLDLFGTYLRENGYNILPQAGNCLGFKHTEETRQKMSASGKNRTFTEEHRKNISQALKGIPGSWLGKKHSEETKEKMRAAQKKRGYSEMHRQLLIERNKKNSGEHSYWWGKSQSEETKRKISKANKGKPSNRKGISHSKETRKKMSESHSGERNPNWNKPVPKKVKEKIIQTCCKYTYTLVSPEGVPYEVNSLRQFAKDNQLDHSQLYKVLNGKLKSCRGWHSITKKVKK